MDATHTNSPSTPHPSSSTASAAGPWRIWLDPAERYSTRKVVPIQHNFQDHPAMQLPALAQLAKELIKTKQCRFIQPGSSQASAFNHEDSDPNGRNIDEVFARMEESGSWIALYNVETHPVYRAFLDDVAACFRPLVEPQEPGIFNVGGFIFVSAPPSVTPFHIDRENNFWLQVKGRKVMNVWDPTDRVAVPATVRDDFILYGGLEEVRLKDGVVQRSHEFDVGPGEGAYFPSTSPHMTRTETSWVKPGDGVSISIGVVFYSSVTRRSAYVHAFNRVLRRMGITPREPNESDTLDRLKFPFGRLTIWAMRLFGSYRAKTGF